MLQMYYILAYSNLHTHININTYINTHKQTKLPKLNKVTKKAF